MAGHGLAGAPVHLLQDRGRVGVGGAVIAQLADAVLFVPLVRQGVDGASLRDGPMKRCFKDADEARVRKHFPKAADGL